MCCGLWSYDTTNRGPVQVPISSSRSKGGGDHETAIAILGKVLAEANVAKLSATAIAGIAQVATQHLSAGLYGQRPYALGPREQGAFVFTIPVVLA
jgi:hypothetical protein